MHHFTTSTCSCGRTCSLAVINLGLCSDVELCIVDDIKESKLVLSSLDIIVIGRMYISWGARGTRTSPSAVSITVIARSFLFRASGRWLIENLPLLVSLVLVFAERYEQTVVLPVVGQPELVRTTHSPREASTIIE